MPGLEFREFLKYYQIVLLLHFSHLADGEFHLADLVAAGAHFVHKIIQAASVWQVQGVTYLVSNGSPEIGRWLISCFVISYNYVFG